jgi:hypothetical protein
VYMAWDQCYDFENVFSTNICVFQLYSIIKRKYSRNFLLGWPHCALEFF